MRRRRLHLPRNTRLLRKRYSRRTLTLTLTLTLSPNPNPNPNPGWPCQGPKYDQIDDEYNGLGTAYTG